MTQAQATTGLNLHDTDNDKQLEYICLSIDGIELLAARSSMVLVESVVDIDTTDRIDGSIGWLSCDGTKVPVFNLDRQLEPQQASPGQKLVCTVLRSSSAYIAIVCQDVTTFRDDSASLQPLPECMRVPGCPVDALCVQSETLHYAYQTSADSMIACYIDTNGRQPREVAS